MPATSLPRGLVFCLVLFGAGLASAQPVSVELKTQSLKEGRPGTIRVVLRTGANETRPVLLISARLEVAQVNSPRQVAGGNLVRTVHGLSLETQRRDQITGLDADDDDVDRFVSLELRAVDDPGPAARQPMPDVVSTARGEALRLVPLLARRSEQRSYLPRAGRCTVTVSWEALVVPKKTPDGVYRLADERRWLPEDELADRRAIGGPRKLFRLTTRHWRRWRGEQQSELLLRQETYAKLPVYRGKVVKRINVRPALFGLAAAERKAQFRKPTAFWRLADGRWILQRRQGRELSYAVVGPKQDAIRGRGDLSVIARVLAEGRSCRLHWGGQRAHPEMGGVVKELFDARPRKDGSLSWAIDAESLVPFLTELGEQKLEPFRRTIREPRQP
ncbi:MAG: hypothetical protein JKY65_13535 [Planctomycetes bacterium]|nr:hypothetical protein [Planctomycetota bacterium]